MESSINSHVVGVQSKGERLQRLRAIRLIFEELEKSNSVCILVACEYLEDIYMHVEDTEGTQKEYIESDKSYESKPFSLNSDEVKNSIVSFLDCWLKSMRLFVRMVVKRNIKDKDQTIWDYFNMV